MRRSAAQLLVPAIASAAVCFALATGSVTRASAQTGAGSQPPPQIVVAIDPGHGGAPNPNNPSQPFDPGAIGVNGVEEKDVTLDVAKRLAALLQSDLVHAVLTRTTDTGPTVAQREQVAIDAHAAVFVSIHCNSYAGGPGPGGSLVLYPNSMGEPLAQALSDALGDDLRAQGIPDDGIQLRNNWWIHAPMPTSTVEIAYLSNPREAALLATEAFREQAAAAIRDGIERFDPEIAQRKAAILAWQRAHPNIPLRTPAPRPAATGAVAKQANGGGVPGFLPWLVLIAAAALALRYRRPLQAALSVAVRAVPLNHRALHRAAARRRRQRLRTQSLVRRTSAPLQRRSVYDDLSL
jgi:N-acetylmuramoyl-L-alanine amidase